MSLLNQVAEFNQSPQARFQVVEHPSALPACCFLCSGSADSRDWFVDLTIQLDFIGALYLCNECLGELAGTVGWMKPDQAKALNEACELLRARNNKLQLENASYHDMERAIRGFIESRSDDGSNTVTSGSPGLFPLPPIVHSDFSSGATETGPSGTEDDLGERTGETSQSSDGQGMDDLCSDDDSGSFKFNL